MAELRNHQFSSSVPVVSALRRRPHFQMRAPDQQKCRLGAFAMALGGGDDLRTVNASTGPPLSPAIESHRYRSLSQRGWRVSWWQPARYHTSENDRSWLTGTCPRCATPGTGPGWWPFGKVLAMADWANASADANPGHSPQRPSRERYFGANGSAGSSRAYGFTSTT